MHPQQPDAETVPQPLSAVNRTHPKRFPTNLSVCLQPSQSGNVQPHVGGCIHLSAASNVAANGRALQIALPALASGPRSSGESVNAEKWFEDSNRNVCGPRSVSFVDRASPIFPPPTYNNMYIEDPPFYLQRKSSSESGGACAAPSVPSCHRSPNLVDQTLPDDSPWSRMDMCESCSEDYRSVIDDLTIQNKKLKHKLRMYEKLHGSHLHGDKVFEIRVYGLPAHRKRELEATLQSFAARLDEDLEKPLPLPSSIGEYPLLDSSATAYKPSPSSTPYSRPLDSGYASISTSGQTSGSLPQYKSSREPERHRQSVESREQNIHSYLQDIPRGILPRRPTEMTEKAKKKLVVRRLEQLFTGTGATVGLHSQSVQQQEVSQSATEADRTATEARGCKFSAEGAREARILPSNTEIPAGLPNDTTSSSHERYRDEAEDPIFGGPNTSSDPTPDQRPTRPLDLDPYRAQVPAENIQYIRHLCVASPIRCATLQSEDMQDWVYLNLLTSMAQLHTINVTPEFVRMAVVEHSKMLELSRDGWKIRWKGGTEGTPMSTDSNSSRISPDTRCENRNEIYPRSKRRKLADNPPAVSYGADGLRKSSPLGHFGTNSSLSYKPLFFHHTRLEDETENHVTYGDSPRSIEIFEDVAVTANNFGSGTFPAFRQTREEGPVIYYNGASFCTDLSGDSHLAPYRDTEFSSSIDHVLGYPPSTDMMSDVCSEDSPMNDIKSCESAGLSRQDMGIKESMASFDDMGSGPNADSSTPLRLEASGIGGVRPCDNFSVNVQVRYAVNKMSDSQVVSRFSSFQEQVDRVMHQIPQHTNDASHHGLLRSSTTGCRGSVQLELVSATTAHLPPSTLPPPSHVFHPFSSSDSEDEDFSENGSVDKASMSARHGDGNHA